LSINIILKQQKEFIMEYTASRLSEGNKLFPAKITITSQGVTLRVPGFFSGKEQTIPFHLISSVDVETPFVGFSSVKIYSVGWDVIRATGFAKADVLAIKEEILAGQSNLNNLSRGASEDNLSVNLNTQISSPDTHKPTINTSFDNTKLQTTNSDPLYNEQINKLIEFALADGELTEKEKQILFKKAEAVGIDLDEFEMVLDAKMFEKKQNEKKLETQVSAAPKSDKFGDVKKCPACGAITKSFSIKCPDCGHEFRNIESSASIQQLFKLINEIESTRKEGSSNPLAGFGKMMAGHMGVKTDTVTNKIIMAIQNFPVPNTKEDMLEFLALSVPNAKKKVSLFNSTTEELKLAKKLRDAWLGKCEQIVVKARFSMKEDKNTLEEINKIAKELGIK